MDSAVIVNAPTTSQELVIRKALISIGVFVALVAAIASIFLGRLDGLIESAIEESGSRKLGAAVKVSGVQTDLQAGRATISRLTLANAAGFQEKYAVELHQIDARVNYQEQVIDSVVIDAPIVNAELKGTKNNFQSLLDGMPDSAESPSSDFADDLILTIKRFEISATTINLLITEPQLGARSFTMEPLVMNNLRGTSEQLSDQILTAIVRHISGQITAYARRELTHRALEKVQEELSEKVGEALKDLGL